MKRPTTIVGIAVATALLGGVIIFATAGTGEPRPRDSSPTTP